MESVNCVKSKMIVKILKVVYLISYGTKYVGTIFINCQGIFTINLGTSLRAVLS